MFRLRLQAVVLTIATAPSFPACAGTAVVRAPRPAPSPAARVALTGMIVNGITARPLPGAIIDLDDRTGLAETGLDGRFHLEDVPVGVHLLGARAQHFRSRVQGVNIRVPDGDGDADAGSRNDFIVLLFAPSGYFAGFPHLGTTPPCRTEADCRPGQICLMTNFKEGDAPACTAPVVCRAEVADDCKLGQQCEPVNLLSGRELRVCQGQPAPEVDP